MPSSGGLRGCPGEHRGAPDSPPRTPPARGAGTRPRHLRAPAWPGEPPRATPRGAVGPAQPRPAPPRAPRAPWRRPALSRPANGRPGRAPRVPPPQRNLKPEKSLYRGRLEARAPSSGPRGREEEDARPQVGASGPVDPQPPPGSPQRPPPAPVAARAARDRGGGRPEPGTGRGAACARRAPGGCAPTGGTCGLRTARSTFEGPEKRTGRNPRADPYPRPSWLPAFLKAGHSNPGSRKSAASETRLCEGKGLTSSPLRRARRRAGWRRVQRIRGWTPGARAAAPAAATSGEMGLGPGRGAGPGGERARSLQIAFPNRFQGELY